MSDKLRYGGSPPTFNYNCVEDPQVLGETLSDIFQLMVDNMGVGVPPTAEDVDDIPESTPPRRLVRFKTTEAMGNTTSKQASAIAVDVSAVDIATPTIIVHDTFNTYPSAGSGKYGWAMVSEQTPGTFIYEIVRLGGEGTVTGSSGDELVGVTSDDTTPAHLYDKMNDTGSYDGGTNHQLVYAEEINGGGNESLRLYTSKVSTTETSRPSG